MLLLVAGLTNIHAIGDIYSLHRVAVDGNDVMDFAATLSTEFPLTSTTCTSDYLGAKCFVLWRIEEKTAKFPPKLKKLLAITPTLLQVHHSSEKNVTTRRT
jgi:hypothetical protein